VTHSAYAVHELKVEDYQVLYF